MNARQFYILTQQQKTEELLKILETQRFDIFADNAQRADEQAVVDEEVIDVPWTITSDH